MPLTHGTAGMAKRPAITATKAKRLPAKKKVSFWWPKSTTKSKISRPKHWTLRRISNSRQVLRAILKEQQCEFGRPSEMY